MASFLSTSEWLEFQKYAGRKAWRFDNGKVRANIIRHDLPFGKNYLYIPHGPELDLNRMLSGFRNELNAFADFLGRTAAGNKSVFIKFEPFKDVVPEFLHTAGLTIRPVRKHVQPRRTVILDLKKSEDELLSEMHHKTRYNIGLAERRGVTIAPGNDVEMFWRLLQRTSKHDNFSTHPKEYYQALLAFFSRPDSPVRTRLFFAYWQSKPVSGVLMLEHDRTAYYLHGALDRDHRALMAPQLLHWRLIREYKRQGTDAYDFWGIDARKWPGVTRFKLGFGGRQVEYPGSFDIPIRKFWYSLYRLKQKIRP